MLLILDPLVSSEFGGLGNYRPRLGETCEWRSGDREVDLILRGDP
jgi:hypothetical protein